MLIVHYEKYEGISIEHCSRVYGPAEDTFLIMDYIIPGNNVLEVGCGTGIISVYCSKLGRKVTCCDVSEEARNCCERNAIRNHVDLEILDSQLFHRIEGTFDTIIFNPPYLPTDDRYEEATQWNGGQDGFDVIRPFLHDAHRHLEDHGSVYIILSSLTDINTLIEEYPQYTFMEKARQSFFFETIYLYQLFKKPGH
jgi:release factor glutamine methyltransferase